MIYIYNIKKTNAFYGLLKREAFFVLIFPFHGLFPPSKLVGFLFQLEQTQNAQRRIWSRRSRRTHH